MALNKKNTFQIMGLALGVFVFGSAFIINMSKDDKNETHEKINKEAESASLSQKLRASALKPVELSEAKIADAQTQMLEARNKESKDKQLPTPTNRRDPSSSSKSPWDIALTGKAPEEEQNNLPVVAGEGGEKNHTDSSKIKDAQNFVNYVSSPGIIKDAVVRKVDAPSKVEFGPSSSHIPTVSTETQNKGIPKSKLARLASMSAESLSTLSGKEQIAGLGQMFKAGTRVYALLPDKLTVTNGEKLDTSLIAFGSTEQKFPNNVTFVGQAQLNKSNRRVEILIDKCVNTRDDSPPVPCKAIVKDIVGDNGLSGKIYDPANWQLLIATAGTFLSTYVLGTLTTTVAQTGITVDPTVANQVRQALASSVNSIATRLSDSINRSGTEITISPGAIVQIFFVDTSTTWNLLTN